MEKIIAPENYAGKRLDKFIAQNFPQYSRVYLKEQIKQGNIFVNGEIAKPSYELKEKDEITTALPTKDSLKILPNPAIKLNIIFENDDVIVIDKPAGLSVHPRQDKNSLPLPQEIDSTLVSGLLAYYPLLIDVGDNPQIRPGIVHRLDKDTSGVMIIAKNQNSFDWLKKQFQDRLAQKKYLVLVNGVMKNTAGIINQPLARSRTNPTKQKMSADGKPAITEYQVKQRFKNYTLLEAFPKTGRLHQIRVHLTSIGHPIVGDKKYGPGHRLTPPGLTRQFLHAKELEIILPSGQKRTFVAPLPIDLNAILKALENI